MAHSRRGGPRLSWWLLLLLVLVGAAVVAARSMGRQRAEAPRSLAPTLEAVRAPTDTPPPARAFQPLPVVATPTLSRPATVASTRASVPTPVPTRPSALAARSPSVTPKATTVPTAEPPPATAAAPPATAEAPTGVATAPQKSVLLTFDAGADRGYAEDILDILRDERVAASFGITGQWARANPDLVRRMAAEGHLVINHTLDHRSFTGASDQLGGLSAARRRAELEDAEAIIAPLIGRSTRPYYRLPYGDDDARVTGDVLPAGYSQKIGWTVDSLGWRGLQAPDIVARCLTQAAPAAVYVFHVGRASQDALALPRIIRGLRERGFGFARAD